MNYNKQKNEEFDFQFAFFFSVRNSTLFLEDKE